MKPVTLLPGDIPVLIDPLLGPEDVVRIDGRVHVGSMAALERFVAGVKKWVLLRTVPPCLMHAETGELVDLEGVPDPRDCSLCGGRHG